MTISAERRSERGASGAASPSRRSPSIRPRRLAHWVAVGAGSGLSPWAPGTVGTLWAWAVFWAAGELLTPHGWWLLTGVAFLVGIWACGQTGRDFGVSDHSSMVWDEVVSFWLLLSLIPGDWLSQGLAFLLFRFFDILKPPPIRQVDARLKGGFGVMFDDLLAAAYALACLTLWETL